MKKQKIVILSGVILLGLVASVYQYIAVMMPELVGAADTKPANGHSWSEMESDSDSVQVSGMTITNLAAPVNSTDAVNKAYADGLGSIPSGVILLWSGSVATIPTGWALCNGSNGTPDLRNKFIVGAGSTYAVAAAGGEATHTLTAAEMPSHTHTDPAHTHSMSAHAHSLPVHGENGVSSITLNSGGQTTGNIGYTSSAGGGNTSSNSGGNTGSAGSGGAHNNLPPYYSLAYIMKL
jgi:microcystin-dependent protein